jgi:hypothetical protein
MSNIAYLFLEKNGKTKNQHASVCTINHHPKTVTKSNNKAVSCCCGLIRSKSKTDHDALNRIKLQKTPAEYEKFEPRTISSEINGKMVVNIPVPKNAHITNISTVPLQRIQSPMESVRHTEMKDSTSERDELVYSILFQI